MRRIVPFTLAAIILAALAAVAMAAGSSSAKPSMKVWGTAEGGAATMAKPRGAHRLVVFNSEDRGQFVDVGEAGESPGDMFILEGRAFYRPGGPMVGRLSVACQLRITTFACTARSTCATAARSRSTASRSGRPRSTRSPAAPASSPAPAATCASAMVPARSLA